MADLIDTTEMYLRTILELEEEKTPPLRARISERLGHSGPTVSQTIARMERDGLVIVDTDRTLRLTDTGRTKAVHVMRKHRLAERLLADVLGLEWEYVHEEACRWEHVMSERVERKILGILGNPVESPYGNPIPGLEELGLRTLGSQNTGVQSLRDLLHDFGKPVTARIKSFAETLQVDPEQLKQLAQLGIVPGNTATFTREGNVITVQVQGLKDTLQLPYSELASFIFVVQ